jgi:dTDP-4-dehydrorhamnose reductase
MLGHKLAAVFGERFDTYVTARAARTPVPGLEQGRLIEGVSTEDLASVERAVSTVEPDVVVNCIGIVKQLDAAHNPVPSIGVNALFPHQLARIAEAHGSRVVQISTDCVFSGRRGGYSEADEPDPVDLYGRTKLLGELENEHCLTVRTSIVGRELNGSHGLLEWFLSQGGPVRGYRRAVFSGLTTEVLAETVAAIVEDQPGLSGIWHVASDPIDKFELLERFAGAYDREVEIEPDESVVIDRSLDDTRFRTTTGIPRPSWDSMLARLVEDPTPYEALRPVPC